MSIVSFDNFIKKYTDVGVDFDKAFGNQCMDIMHQYVVEVLGLIDGRILAAPAAKDVYQKFDIMVGKEFFDKISNTPDGVPNKGDIIFWGTGIGQYGHVALFIEGDTKKFRSFDQNFPVGSKCHIQDHTYTGVLGWLRFKKTENTLMEIDQKTFKMLVAKSTNRDELYDQLGVPRDPVEPTTDKLRAVIEGYKNLATGLQRQLDQKAAELTNKEEQVDRIKQTYEASAKTDGERIAALEKAQSAWEKERELLKGQVDGFAKDKGELTIALATQTTLTQEWKTKAEQAAAGSAASLSLGDVLVLLFKKAFTIKLR